MVLAFLACHACHAFVGCSVNLLPGLAWKTHLYAGNYCLQQHGCCLPLSFQVSPASSSPSSFLLPKWEASAMSGGGRSCRHPVNKLFILPQPCLPKCDESFHSIRNKTVRTHTQIYQEPKNMAELLNFRLEAIQSAEEKMYLFWISLPWFIFSHSNCLLNQSS